MMSPDQVHTTPAEAPIEAGVGVADSAQENGTYRQILRSSALIGGSTLVSVAIGIIRTKAMALMLGPSGFGLMSLYSSILDLALSIAAMGINSSGVRQIAEAASSDDQQRIARTASVLRRTALVLGLLGAVVLAAFSRQVSVITFGSDQHAGAVALLALALFFRVVADSQGALIQGLRRIADLARMGVIGALLSAVVSIAFVYSFGEQGVAPSLVGGAAMTLVVAWWFSRKVQIEQHEITRAQAMHESTALLKLGFAFMGSGFLTLGAAYIVRLIVTREIGLDAAGFYQAAWTLGGLYVGVILQAMGADFYPRLVGVATNDEECNRLVNEQTHVSLLLAGPGVLATLTFAPLVIWIFYSPDFSDAVEVLRWICLGIALRVITWPMGFIIVAKNRQALFLGVDFAWAVVNVGLTFVCVKAFGLNGAGIAFFGSYLVHMLIVYPIVWSLSGFSLSKANLKTGLLVASSIMVVFCSFCIMSVWMATTIGLLVALVLTVYAIRTLIYLMPKNAVPQPILRLLELARLAP